MSSPDPSPGASTAIAMVATSSPRLPDANAIVEASAKVYATPGEPADAFFINDAGDAVEPQWEDGKLVFALGDAKVAVTLIPKPIPWSQLDGPCAGSWWWPDAAKKMREHTHHFLVAVVGGPTEPVERRIILTHVVRAVLQGTDAVGVYWAEATIVHEPKAFLEQSASMTPRKIPGSLWLDVVVQKNEDGTQRCFTAGMEPLGFAEIEVPRSRMRPIDLIGFVGDFACYIVNDRKAVYPGDMVGRTPEQRFKVTHGPSMVGRGQVMRLEIPEPPAGA